MKRLSDRQMVVVLVALALTSTGLVCAIQYLDWRSHRLANIPTDRNYAVREEDGRFFYNPTGFDVRRPITEEQYRTYHRVRSPIQLLALASGALLFCAVVLMLRHKWNRGPPDERRS